ncbi:MAG: helix-turn-helix transcriptional regulator [Bacilli bacterium]|nr:helix-turn-helix transcriptional regulator [Bacilli bacterium]
MIDFRRVGRKISLFRRKMNLSQDDLAERMFVSRQLVSKWENGTGIPKIDNIIDLCEILNVGFEELLCINDESEDGDK